MAAVEQLTFGHEPAEVRAAAGPSGPGYEIERELAAVGASCVAGVDEVGRGAWAGPVTVCAENAGYPSPAHQEALAALGPTPHHRLSWSYLDDLPRWRHLKRPRPDVEGQLSLL